MEILTIALTALVVFVVAHFVIFWVVKTMYPPQQKDHVTFAEPVVQPPPQTSQTFTQPSVVEQHVTLPTYETPIPTETPHQEGERRGPPPAESTSIRGDSRVATA